MRNHYHFHIFVVTRYTQDYLSVLTLTSDDFNVHVRYVVMFYVHVYDYYFVVRH